MNDVAYVTQEMWDQAQAALRAALPRLKQHTPPLSTAGTMVSLREQVRAAIVPSGIRKVTVASAVNEMREIAEDLHLSNRTTIEEDEQLERIFEAIERRARL